jgi:hypothetical protein
MLATMVTCAPLHNLPEVTHDENMHVRGTLQRIKPSRGAWAAMREERL